MKIFILLFFASLMSAYQPGINPPGLTAVYENKMQVVKLKWNHNDKKVKQYILQRSGDERTWTVIKSISVGEPNNNKFISYRDQNPEEGKNFYRLKTVLNDGTPEYSRTVMVIIGKPGGSWIMFPVPVRDVLNLQYNGTELITGVIGITIQNIATRQVFHRLRMASTSRFIAIPVSNLGRGVYFIRITIGNEITWNQRFSK